MVYFCISFQWHCHHRFHAPVHDVVAFFHEAMGEHLAEDGIEAGLGEVGDELGEEAEEVGAGLGNSVAALVRNA